VNKEEHYEEWDLVIMDGNVVMTLLESLLPLYEYLITPLETIPIEELTIEFISTRLIHKVCKWKENEFDKGGATLNVL